MLQVLGSKVQGSGLRIKKFQDLSVSFPSIVLFPLTSKRPLLLANLWTFERWTYESKNWHLNTDTWHQMTFVTSLWYMAIGGELFIDT